MAILSRSGDGDAYYDLGLRADSATRRFTAYVAFPDDAADATTSVIAAVDLVERNRASVEEIDVDAVSKRHACEIALAALRRDYDPGGTIVSVEERHGTYV